MPPTCCPISQSRLDLLILQMLSLEPAHGYAIARRLEQASRAVAYVNQGSVYPALHRLEQKGWLKAEWISSETGREAKVYSLILPGSPQHGGGQSAVTVAIAISFFALVVTSASGSEQASITDTEGVPRSNLVTNAIRRRIRHQCDGQDALVNNSGDGHFTGASNVRAIDRELALALVDGIERSPTIHELVTSINRSDVTAYLIRGRCSYPAMACLSVMSGRSSMRYLRINVQLPGERSYAIVWNRADLVSLIAHELQHVMEIAKDSSVVDGESLRRHYQVRGSDQRDERLDSDAAVEKAFEAKSEFLAWVSSQKASGPRRTTSCVAQ